MGGDGFHGGIAEQVIHLDLLAERPAKADTHPEQEQRVSTQIEEVNAKAEVFVLENVLPDL